MPPTPLPGDAAATAASRRFGRRDVLALAGWSGLATAGASFSPSWQGLTQAATSSRAPARRWSDPATWGGSIPGRNDVARIDQPVLLDADAEVAGVRIGPNGSLTFSPGRSRRLVSRGNIVVRGRLSMRPADGRVTHRIVFAGVNESRFRGGHVHAPAATDVGLWIVEGGTLDGRGTPKTAWTRLTRATRAGQQTIMVADCSGWRVGDEIVITPTEATTVDRHWTHHDRRRINAIDGRRIVLDAPADVPASASSACERACCTGPRCSTSRATWRSRARPRAGAT